MNAQGRSPTYFIMRTMRSTPSLSRNCCLISGSANAEQRTSKRFSMNSVSSAFTGSFLRYRFITTGVRSSHQAGGKRLTERILRMVSTPSFLPSSRRFGLLFWRRMERISAAYPRFSSCFGDSIRCNSHERIFVFDTNGVDKSELKPSMFSNIPNPHQDQYRIKIGNTSLTQYMEDTLSVRLLRFVETT